jgi:hypothetical protein
VHMQCAQVLLQSLVGWFTVYPAPLAPKLHLLFALQIASVSKSLCHHAKFRSVCCNANTG